MNTSKLKSYAPSARRDFIRAVTERANLLGLSEKAIEPVEEKGDVAIIAGRAWPLKVAEQRKGLEQRVEREGFGMVMEAVAYTWFNRISAIRYMELHDYLGHGFRVLSHPGGSHIPEILEQATKVDLPGLDKDKVVELKLDGNKDAELYRMLLIAQCNALHQAMPFLFEAIEDETELLLPDNLIKTDSLIRQLVEGIDESDWEEIEIIGWLYQFYISEKKDQVIGKVVKSEDIPAATQLFTPNWIVKYLVQNSLGAQWLATYPDSPIKGQMEYYIEPAEQTDEVKAQLAAITPSTLNPEELTLIDPASGSGHILVEAYELFKAIYLERGYRQRDVAQLILEKNLFGLDIDGRAAQLTGFALMMKGRADDRRLFERGVKLNVMALVDSKGFDAERIAEGVNMADYGLQLGDLTELTRLFEHATTFGSLIQVPEGLAAKLPALKQFSEATSQDLFMAEALKRLGPLVQQAEMLAAQYDAVVANPPYMGSKYMDSVVKRFAMEYFVAAKSDLYACFIERTYALVKNTGCSSLVTIQNWMFLSSFEAMRERMFRDKTIQTLVQVGPNSFPTMNTGKVAQAAVFSMANRHLKDFVASYTRLSTAPESADKGEVFLTRNPLNQFHSSTEDFGRIPGKPVAYWVTDKVIDIYARYDQLDSVADPRQGFATGDNDRFLRQWSEVAIADASLTSETQVELHVKGRKWVPCNKGGSFRRWFGNNNLFVAFDDKNYEALDNQGNHLPSKQYYFKPGWTWSTLTSSRSGFRFSPLGYVFETKGSVCFPRDTNDMFLVGGYLNSKLVENFLAATSPTMDFHEGPIRRIPFKRGLDFQHIDSSIKRLIDIGRKDWDVYERSWDFQSLPILTTSTEPTLTLESSYTAWITQNRETIAEMKRLEEENNRLFIDAYGLANELTPDVPIEQITLTVNPAYRYGGNLAEEELWTRFREDTMQELISYAIGCMMGRYSLDEPGLIYANSGNDGFDLNRYTSFPADDDGIVPIMDMEWFEDDAAARFDKFINVAWPSPSPQPSPTRGEGGLLDVNLKFIADSLSPKKGEAPRDTIRRYFSSNFFKDHLKTYKKRPIYWLFSSGKLKAFECLVYLHRYNESTLSRMRNEYVTPLQGKFIARADYLQNEIDSAASASESNKLQKQLDMLRKKQAELKTFDDELRHYADQRIKLDLDDGVKVNYGKFGNLLAEVKAVTGKK